MTLSLVVGSQGALRRGRRRAGGAKDAGARPAGKWARDYSPPARKGSVDDFESRLIEPPSGMSQPRRSGGGVIATPPRKLRRFRFVGGDPGGRVVPAPSLGVTDQAPFEYAACGMFCVSFD